MTKTRLDASGLIWGPVLFVAAWAIGGLTTQGYSPVADAISRLAAVDAATKPLMDLGFVAYGIGVTVGAYALRSSLGAPATAAFIVNGMLTLGVWLTPLDRSDAVDVAHGVVAGLAYVALAAALISAARAMAPSRMRSLTTTLGVVVGVCLLLTVVVDSASGLFQRLGLTLADLWLIATGWAAVRASEATTQQFG